MIHIMSVLPLILLGSLAVHTHIAPNKIRRPLKESSGGNHGCCWSLCVSGQAAASQTMESHLKRTLYPKAIKTGRLSVGESLALQLASADDYTSLLYPSFLFPPSRLSLHHFFSFSQAHKHLSPRSPSLFLSFFQPVGLDADETRQSLVFAATSSMCPSTREVHSTFQASLSASVT